MSQINESCVEVGNSPIYTGNITYEDKDNRCPLKMVNSGCTSDELVMDVPSTPANIDDSINSECQILAPNNEKLIHINLGSDVEDADETPHGLGNLERVEDEHEAGLVANYASDENAIFVSADIYEREKANFDELVQNTLKAEKRKVQLESQDKYASDLDAAEKDVLQLNARLALMSQYIDNLRVESEQGNKDKPGPSSEAGAEADEKPSWSHIYAGVNRHRHIAGGSVAEFYQHKTNIISGLKTLYEPDGPPPSASEFTIQPKALLVPLLPHQTTGLKWLLWREAQKVSGGILADDMGLGKTLSIIALIVAANENKRLVMPKVKTDFDYKKSFEHQLQLFNKLKTPWKRINILESDSEDEPDVLPPKRPFLPYEEADDERLLLPNDECSYNAGTLIVCPMSVMSQWAAEATTKVKHKELNVHTYHGPDRRAISVSDLRSMDLVITSYNTLVSEWKRFGSDSRLFSSRWERLVLDEAHIIRNTKTVCFGTVTNIKAQHHWALTGTPIQNCALDCFALLKFLSVPNFKDLTLWRRYLNQGIAGHCRMSYLIKPLMLRRTKLQLQLAGEMPALPPLQVKLIDVQLTPAEMNVYQILSAISLRIFAQFLRQREQNNQDLHYYSVQTTPNFIVDEVDSKYKAIYENFLRSIGYDPRERVQGIFILVLFTPITAILLSSGPHGKGEMLCNEFNISADEDDQDELESEYLNINGQGTIEKSTFSAIKSEKNPVKEEDDLKKEECQSGIKYEEDTLHTSMTMATAMKLLNPSNPIFEFKRDSSKLRMVFEILQKLLQETNDKIIVVSQWTSYLAVIKNRLDEMGHETLDFNGKMDASERGESLSEFNNTSNNKRILLLSLTAGGVGLNLNVANHLLMADLHWNPQLERQAQDRIYRYGQKKPSFIYRLMCKDTVEQRIKALQDYKIEISNVVLNPGQALHISGSNGLSLKDLKKIFGMQ
ncbi:transcription termination factor 2 [Drosophila sulfurigaster albostrigata]|uniref:transcription termination factor 2 n=1 Tax=Drosophila sulfurigaster albostrigata TaxID=89887 RepID=UPI002D21C05D|nr:transcription termination factor 2 [Drosophila sulfurigaster albostrigata]